MTTDISVGARWDSLNKQQDGDNLSSSLFEKGRIKALTDEREHVQKDLVRINCKITDLYIDLRDGKMLLEILSGERLPRPTKGKQRVHLENIRAHDIVDGSPRLTSDLNDHPQVPDPSMFFNAIIHKHRADLIQYNKLSKSKAMCKLNNSFEVVH